MKYGKVHAPGVTLCLPFHCLIIQVPFLRCISSKETEGEKGKGSERGEMTWTAFFWKRNCTGMWPQQAGQGGSGGATVAECGHNKQAREAQAGQVSP